MMLIGLFTLVLALGAQAYVICGKNKIQPQDLFTLAKDTDRFAVNLYKRALETQRSDNIFFSPASISIATSMLYSGATGETAEQIKRTVFPEVQPDKINFAYGCLVRNINEKGRGFELDTADGLFVDDGFSVKKSYKDLLTLEYESTSETVQFRQAPEQARTRINQFVAEKTRNRITDLLPAGSVDATTALVLVNAIYFKGTWNTTFQKSSTQKRSFNGLDGSKNSQVDLMELKFNEYDEKRYFSYAEDESLGVQVLGMPYTEGEMTMYVILPRGNRGLKTFEERLDGSILRDLIQKANPTKLERVAIPKFKVSHSLPLKNILQKIGITKAFSGSADFSKISDQHLQVSDAVHKAFVEVNEEGTEAAAATGFAVRHMAALPPRQRPSFVADRPFTYLIQHNPTKTILFLGRYVQSDHN